MPICTLSVEVKSRWWLPLYFKTLMLFCQVVQREPDYEKVSAFIVKYGVSHNLIVQPEQKNTE
ncbi:hypothetical protein KGG49_13410 [Klebsiella aerogenes]|uniref:hypothetical protein n=1 Tax=Klebsiella aerogenes TaxID=548 RepID=UPI001D0BD13A|nr:hypothetical protein [Klebsiella aerogenes]MCB8475880.1 hypothetical protein [Klebsiella aerogenes]HCR2972332.1 hypothetical protein [Klebsiella aerogenes]